MRVDLLHGFNTEDGSETINKSQLAFRQHDCEVRELSYGYMFRARVRLCTRGVAKTMAAMAEPGSILIGHSHGCATAVMAVEEGAPYSALVLVNPALDRGFKFPRGVLDCISIWHSPSDHVVTAARLIPWSRWGDMGKVGHSDAYSDPRIFQHNTDRIFGTKTGHSGIWKQDLRVFVDIVMKDLKKTGPGI